MVITSSRPAKARPSATSTWLAYAEGGVPRSSLSIPTPELGAAVHLAGVPAPGRATADEALEHHDLRSGSPEVWQYSPNLFLVPASALGNKASVPPIPGLAEFAGLLADLREAFDYVIIDVPAISEPPTPSSSCGMPTPSLLCASAEDHKQRRQHRARPHRPQHRERHRPQRL